MQQGETRYNIGIIEAIMLLKRYERNMKQAYKKELIEDWDKLEFRLVRLLNNKYSVLVEGEPIARGAEILNTFTF